MRADEGRVLGCGPLPGCIVVQMVLVLGQGRWREGPLELRVEDLDIGRR